MSKTCKNKIKAKVEKANAKTKGRVKKAVAKAACAFAIATVIVGCLHPGEQAQKSETMNVTIRDSVIAVNIGAKKSTANCASNTVELAESERTYDVTLLSQAQSLESSGSETFGQTQTPTQDIKPDTNIEIPVNKSGGGAQAVGSVLGDAAASAVKGLFSKSGTDNAAATQKSENCADGSCKTGSCTDGACNPGETCTDCEVK